MNLNHAIEFPTWNDIPPEFLTSVIALLIIAILALVVRARLKSYDPLKPPRGILYAAEELVGFADRQVQSMMGPAFDGFGGYILVLGLYIFISFILGFIGIPNFFQPGSEKFLAPLPNPFTNTAMPLSIALLTFFWIHFTAMRYKGWGYFKRYTEPFAVFLPINLVTMWSPVLSLTLRLFGNALAGFCVVTLVYTGFEYAFTTVGVGLALTPLLAPIVHLYFDVFDGLIQLTVFCMLTMMNVAAEYVSPEELAEVKRAQEEKRAQRQRRRMSRRSAGAPRA